MDGNATGKNASILRSEVFPSDDAVIGLMLFFSLTDIAIIIGNTLVLAIVFGNSRLQTNTNFFITNLCFVDLLSGVILIPFVMDAMVSKESSKSGKLCDFVAFVDALYSTATSLTIAAIAIDRYHSIVNCLYYETIVTHRRTMLAIAWIWLQTLVISLCPLLGWGNYSFDPYQFKCSLDLPDQHGFLYFTTGTSVLIPFMMVVFCYTQIHLVARRHARSMVAIHIHDTGQRIKAVSSRKTKLVYLVVGLYSVCWLPYFSIKLLKSIRPSLGIPAGIVTLATVLSLVNGACNPLLYALITSQYRAGMHRLYRRFKRRVGRTIVSPSVDPSKSSWSFSRPISSLYRFLQEQQETGGLPLKCFSPANESTIHRCTGGMNGSRSSLRGSHTPGPEKQVLLTPTAYIQTLKIPERKTRHKVDVSPLVKGDAPCVNGWVLGHSIEEDIPVRRTDFKDAIKAEFENRLRNDSSGVDANQDANQEREVTKDMHALEEGQGMAVAEGNNKIETKVGDILSVSNGERVPVNGVSTLTKSDVSCNIGILVMDEEIISKDDEDTYKTEEIPSSDIIFDQNVKNGNIESNLPAGSKNTNGVEQYSDDVKSGNIVRCEECFDCNKRPSTGDLSSSEVTQSYSNNEKEGTKAITVMVDVHSSEKRRTSGKRQRSEEALSSDLELQFGDLRNAELGLGLNSDSEGKEFLREDPRAGKIEPKARKKRKKKRNKKRSDSYSSVDTKGEECQKLTGDAREENTAEREQLICPDYLTRRSETIPKQLVPHGGKSEPEVDVEDDNACTVQPLLASTKSKVN